AVESDRTTMTLQSLSLPACALVVFLSCTIGRTTANTGYQKPSFFDFNSWWYHQPRGPQIFSCLTYLERYVRVDCEFPRSDKIPGPFCEFKQDGRLMGTTNPNNPVHLIPPVETRRRSNVTLVSPNVCRLTWMPMSDDRAYTYTCRVYQGSTWKENSMSFTQSMANSQSINPLKACLTEDQTLKIECEFTKGKQTTTPICTFEVDKKIVATTNNISKPVDPTIKNPGQASLEENKCVLTWAAFSEDQGKMYNCTIHYEAPTTLGIKVEKKETSTCSAGNTLMHGGAILLLAFVLPVLSGLLTGAYVKAYVKTESFRIISFIKEPMLHNHRALSNTKRQQKSPDPQVDVPIMEDGTIATAVDPSAITAIHSAATFSSEQPIKYVFKTEGNTGQVTYRVIHVAEGQMDAQSDGAAAVSVVTGFPAATQTGTPAVTR
ncbi:upstream stimulatory factor 1-like isoform X2, partial [Clarias magur]